VDGRRPRLIATMLAANADVICVQEMTFERRGGLWGLPQWTEAFVAAGYAIVMQKFSQKELEKNSDRNLRMVGRKLPTGLATFYRTDMFTEFLDSKHGSGSGISLFLRLREGNLSICVNNIHLIGDPSKFDVHMKQLHPITKHFEAAEKLLPAAPSNVCFQVICGDFNGDVYNTGLPSEVSQWFRDRSFQRAATGHSWAGGGSSVLRLDHIMYRLVRYPPPEKAGWGSVREACCEPASDEESNALLRSIAAGSAGLPNELFPSDHMMVSTLFNIFDDYCL
jgi:mRNA deadenylase 3'-5' endonuclease subunit Ccr4